jgi:hypothetical protein
VAAKEIAVKKYVVKLTDEERERLDIPRLNENPAPALLPSGRSRILPDR